MALIIRSENSMVVGSVDEKSTSREISSSSTTVTTSSKAPSRTSGLTFRPGAGGIFFSSSSSLTKKASATPAVDASSSSSSSSFLEEVIQFTTKNTKKGTEWFGEEYIPEMTNSILPYRKLGDESDVAAILQKAENGGMGLGEERAQPDTIVSVCGIESAMNEQVWSEIARSSTSAEYKYRDLRVMRMDLTTTAPSAGASAISTKSWSFIKPTATANTKPYVVDSALFLSDMAVLPINISTVSADDLKKAFSSSLSKPTSGLVSVAEGTAFMRRASSYLGVKSSLYNTLVKLQVNGGGGRTKGGLLKNTLVVLIGSFNDDGSLLYEIRKEITETVMEIMRTFGGNSAVDSTGSATNFAVVSAPSAETSIPFLMRQLHSIRTSLEEQRVSLGSKLELNQGLKMQVICAFNIKGETVVCSRILTGSVAVGEVVEIGPFPGVKDSKYEDTHQMRIDLGRNASSRDLSFSVTETVEAIKHYDKFVSTAYAGQLVGIRLSGKNFTGAGTGKLKASLSWRTTTLAASRAFSLHTGLVMTSTRWRSEEDCPADVAIPAVDEIEVGSLKYTAPEMDSLTTGRRFVITCGSFEGEATVVENKPTSVVLRPMTSDCLFVQAPRSVTTIRQFAESFDFTSKNPSLDGITISAGGLVIAAGKAVEATFRCRRVLSIDFTSVVMILRRILPYELVHTLLEYATPDAIKPFSRKEEGKTVVSQRQTKQEERKL